jgi:TRAP-type C4-dicarboxylate transport system permease large subunit
MGVGGIAMLIPPSSLAVVLGSLAGISIAKLLIAGLIPGLIMAFESGGAKVGHGNGALISP